MNKNILLGVSGGIACYKSVTLASAMVKMGINVMVVMTKNATEFVSPLTFETITGNRVAVLNFDKNRTFEVEHISIAQMADLVVIAPATANVIAKFAHGIADDMLTSTVLACNCPKICVPAMNTNMYENAVTCDNIKLLKHYGWEIIEPVSGRLACKTVGIGRMREPEEILNIILPYLSDKKDMKGLKVLVTAGATREAIDPVRYITNHSSGKMGYALAKAALLRGAEVTLVSGNTNLTKPLNMKVIDVVSAKDMFNEVTKSYEDKDIIIKAAAVADFTPEKVNDEKIKKDANADFISLNLNKTDDILAWLGNNKNPNQFLCGFSMETSNLIENSKLKLTKKKLDMIVANNLKQDGAGFNTDTNVVTIITKNDEITLPLLQKDEVANKILDEIILKRKI
ncbi:MAG: bifunctional phosphopantothenoylcysteine decarboxylase/phosphopantothenate--cysteine ligase CoaBC [Clostridia bacterium]